MGRPKDMKEAILAWISRDDRRIEEVRELCLAAGYSIVSEVRQARSRPDPRYYLGKGKVAEIAALGVAEHLIVPCDLDPPQTYNIASGTDLKVADRTRLILEIFRSRANSPESRLQVELADLHHQLPIVKEYVHRGKLSEKPGFMAGGDYEVDYYHDMIRRRMSGIERELEEIRRRRSLIRAKRRRNDMQLVAIAGYTNAGKSTLMNALMERQDASKTQESSPEVFTTLATATRRMKGCDRRLLTDTVGFVSELPHFMVQGFLSTLEEVFDADMVLLVVDASEDLPTMIRKLEESLTILRDGDVAGKVLIVLNKSDLVRTDPSEIVAEVQSFVQRSGSVRIDGMATVSAATGEGTDTLTDLVDSVLPSTVMMEMEVPYAIDLSSLGRALGRRYRLSFVEAVADRKRYRVSYDPRWEEDLRDRIAELGGTIVDRSGRGTQGGI